MKTVNIYEAKTNLSRLVDRAVAGEEIVIGKAGTPMVRLVPYRPQPTEPRTPGAWRGRVTIASDFDDLPGDLADAFAGDKP